MKITCEFCNNYMTELDENCPHCGAINPQYKRQSDQTPRTIEELQAWYTAHNLPPKEVTRFFIGENYTGARAFGIYRDGERFIVYKNKDDGSRAIRYDGSDEAYAVNELYLKLKERIAEQKVRNGGSQQASNSAQLKGAYIIAAVLTVVMLSLFVVAFVLFNRKFDSIPNRGYYEYEGNQYYYLNGWYEYDTDTSDWVSTEVDSDFRDNANTYYQSADYDSSFEASNFEDTTYYSDWKDSNWDSDSNWSGSDSWDSGGGDWSSDW